MIIDPNEPAATPTLVSRRRLLGRSLQGVAFLGAAGGISAFLAACGSSTKSSSSSTSAGAASASTSASTAATAALTSVAAQYCYLLNVQFAGSYFATVNGYYTADGLKVDLLPGGPSIAPEPVVASGRALVGVTHTAEAVQAMINGAPLKIIGATFQKNPTCIASLASKPLKTPTDMYGRKIGISDTNQPIWQSFVKANQLDVSKINVVTVGFDVTSLASGEIDGIMAFAPNEPSILKLNGVDTYVMLLSDFKYPLMEDLYIARASDVADPARMKLLAAFMKAESLGWSDVLKNPDQAAQLAVNQFGKGLGLSLAQQQLDVAAQNAFVADTDTQTHGLFWMTDQKVSGTISSLALGGVTADPSMFTNSVLTEVYHGGSTPV